LGVFKALLNFKNRSFYKKNKKSVEQYLFNAFLKWLQRVIGLPMRQRALA